MATEKNVDFWTCLDFGCIYYEGEGSRSKFLDIKLRAPLIFNLVGKNCQDIVANMFQLRNTNDLTGFLEIKRKMRRLDIAIK